MSAPAGWDEKSWLDVCTARERLQALVARLRQLEGVEDADAEALQACFDDIAEAAQLGSMAASWCRGD